MQQSFLYAKYACLYTMYFIAEFEGFVMRQHIAEKVFQDLEEMILTGRISEGERLDELQLSKRFKVSRTPLREAFQKLANGGLIEIVPNKGAFVSKPSLIDVIEMFDVMAALESLCAKLSAHCISDGELEELAESVRQCKVAAHAEDKEAYYKANLDFHRIIYMASGNKFLSKQTEKLKNRLTSYRRIQLQARGRLLRSLEEHQAIFSAISSADGDLAYRLMNDHIAVQGQKFTDVISQFK